MAEFIYKDYSTELKFGNYVFELPLNEQTAELIEETFYKRITEMKPNTAEEINKAYDDLMDALDAVFGEGAADKIMERYNHPGILEVMGVINFIVTEFRDKYTEAVEDMKKTAPKTAPVNRVERRARR